MADQRGVVSREQSAQLAQPGTEPHAVRGSVGRDPLEDPRWSATFRTGLRAPDELLKYRLSSREYARTSSAATSPPAELALLCGQVVDEVIDGLCGESSIVEYCGKGTVFATFLPDISGRG